MSDRVAPQDDRPRIRAATAADQPVISGMVHAAGINPLGLHWQRFVVVEIGRQIAGIGQVKPHRDGSRELASIAVVPEQRGRGIARLVIEALVATEAGPLYLTCRAELEPFYTRFGFRRLDRPHDMPCYFRLILGLLRLVYGPGRRPLPVIVMFRPGSMNGVTGKNSTSVL